MPSRKRNKGKERKAKKAALEAEVIESKRAMARKAWHGWARRGENIRSVQFITQCNHGCDLMIPDDNHPVTSFMDAFFMNCYFAQGRKDIVGSLADSFGTQLAVWNDDRHRKMTRDLMLVIGANMILLGNEANIEIAYVLMVLENYDGSSEIDSTMNSRVVTSKARDFSCGGSGLGRGGSVRDVVKFYRKRLSCSCFKKMHLHVRKTLPKLGMCNSCGQTKDRSLLSVCSKCRVCQYCSRECQVADWPAHKGRCDILCDAHQRSRQNDYE